MAQITDFFAGANSGEGFRNLFPEIADIEDTYDLMVLKGGPGVGKNTFMREVARAMEAAGTAVERLWCSGDPDSLDGVVLPELRCAVVDGTSPHGSVTKGHLLSPPPLSAGFAGAAGRAASPSRPAIPPEHPMDRTRSRAGTAASRTPRTVRRPAEKPAQAIPALGRAVPPPPAGPPGHTPSARPPESRRNTTPASGGATQRYGESARSGSERTGRRWPPPERRISASQNTEKISSAAMMPRITAPTVPQKPSPPGRTCSRGGTSMASGLPRRRSSSSP